MFRVKLSRVSGNYQDGSKYVHGERRNENPCGVQGKNPGQGVRELLPAFLLVHAQNDQIWLTFSEATEGQVVLLVTWNFRISQVHVLLIMLMLIDHDYWWPLTMAIGQ